MDALEQAKQLVKAQLGEDLRAALGSVRRRQPCLSLEQAWQKLAEEQPGLLAYASRVESDDWLGGVKPEPVFRFVDKPMTKSWRVDTESSREVWPTSVPIRVEA